MKKSYPPQKRAFPKAGTTEFQSLQTQAVAYLVQRAEYSKEADDLGIKVTDAEIQKNRRGQEAVLPERPEEVRGGSQAAGLHRRRPPGRTSRPARRPRRSTRHHEGRQGLRRRPAEVLRREQGSVLGRRVARRPSHPRQDEGGGRQAPLGARGRRRLREAREEVLARSRLEGPGRQAHDLARPDGRSVRQGSVLAQDERALAAGQDRVRLPPDPAAGGRQGRLGDALLRGQAQIKTQLLEERKNKAVSDWAADTEKKYDGKVTYAAGFEPPATSTGAGEETTTGE